MTYRLTSATPVLRSDDYERSRAFFTDGLGFKVIEEGGDPPRFGIFQKDGAVLFVDSWNGADDAPSASWSAYIHVDDLASFATEVEAAGVVISKPLHDTVYGMREFELTDPDGNIICFGESMD